MKRVNDEQPQAWLDRVQCQIILCGFSKIVEYLLIDRFMCELNANEIESIRHAAVDSWTFGQLHAYFDNWNVDVSQLDMGNDTIEQYDCLNVYMSPVNIKCEFVSKNKQQT